MFRKIVFKILGGTVFITIIVMWLCLPLYWGSRGFLLSSVMIRQLMPVWKSNHFTNKLTVRIIDRDGGSIGKAVTQGLVSHTRS